MAKKRSSLGCLFWIALILLVFVIVLFNRKTIENVIQSTDFLSVLKKEKPGGTPEKEPEITRELIPEDSEDERNKIIVDNDDTLVLTVPKEITEDSNVPEIEEKVSPEENRKLRKSNIYFIEVSENGKIGLKKFQR